MLSRAIPPLIIAFAAGVAGAQTFATLNNVLPLAGGGGYHQDFDGLGTVNRAAGNLALNAPAAPSLTGIFAKTSGSNTGAVNVLFDSGSSSTGGLKNESSPAGDADRALGTIGSGTVPQLDLALRIRNNTGAPIGTVFFQYFLEQYRSSTLSQEKFAVSYRFLDPATTDAAFLGTIGVNDGLILAQTGWRTDKFLAQQVDFDATGNRIERGNKADADALGNAPVTTNGPLNGNLFANMHKVESYILLGRDDSATGGMGSEVWMPGTDLVLRWQDVDNNGSDGTLGLDNVAVVPEPASIAILGVGVLALARRRRKSA